MSPSVPTNYLGLWQRTLLEQAKMRDVTSRVFWLQTHSWHGDLRIPANRPDFSQTSSLQACSRKQLLWLLQQEGFVGMTRVDGDYCEWLRYYDYRPTGLRDIGRMVFIRHEIEEYGVEQDYFEHWQQVPIASPVYSARQAVQTAYPAIVLQAGEYFIYLRPRQIDSSNSALCWADVRAQRATEDTLRLLADYEISFGKIEAQQWRIISSTLPWREGCELHLNGNWADLHTADNQPIENQQGKQYV